MSNLMDYMDWRGDVSFAGSPFNEIDNIILAMTAFVDFSGIVGSCFDTPPVSFTSAMEKFETLPDEKKYLGVLIPPRILEISRRAVRCPRYSGLRLSGFVNVVDEDEQMQFAALTLILPDDSLYIAYRGTDDTIIGWKEDFRLSFITPIPAHLRAREYLTEAAAHFEGELRLGGHSKGGNLAMWAASHCGEEIQRRILRVYNNDGPGFLPEVLAEPSYSAVADRIITFLPQSSLVGAFLERGPVCKIVKSSETAILQHDPLSWEVMGTRFVYLDKRSKFGEHSEDALRKWLYSMSVTEREQFTEMLFTVIDSTGAKTLTDLNEAKVKNFNAIMKAVRSLDRDSRAMMYRVMRGLFGWTKDDDSRRLTAAGTEPAHNSGTNENDNPESAESFGGLQINQKNHFSVSDGELKFSFLLPGDDSHAVPENDDDSINNPGGITPPQSHPKTEKHTP